MTAEIERLRYNQLPSTTLDVEPVELRSALLPVPGIATCENLWGLYQHEVSHSFCSVLIVRQWPHRDVTHLTLSSLVE
jgi:hypothetical protein